MSFPVVTPSRLDSEARTHLVALEVYKALKWAQDAEPETTVEEFIVALVEVLDDLGRQLRRRAWKEHDGKGNDG